MKEMATVHADDAQQSEKIRKNMEEDLKNGEMVVKAEFRLGTITFIFEDIVQILIGVFAIEYSGLDEAGTGYLSAVTS